MEVAGHWRREWAGTAEYGKVTEGGVTRRVARAMEVVHASAPGARMRVMRAAYHSSAAKGAPAASFLMHSSHSVISSGFDILESPSASFLESPSLPSKPLEISSTPLESSPERPTENYKVTEPDDYDISEPSKWKSGIDKSSDRVPSDESSSADNASTVDLETRHKNLVRKYSYDSENSDIPMYKRNNAINSSLLDEPVALSTLKYKSLLNGHNDWNNRRKSYSFEPSSPQANSPSGGTVTMESSTDSGICKSTELLNDTDLKFSDRRDTTNKKDATVESFKTWLAENRSGSFHVKDFKPCKLRVTEEESRRIKKVEFCQTEVHFTPDTGTVSIIATDEKPPPSQDFRKRRSLLLPLVYDKPVTLLSNTSSEKSLDINKHDSSLSPRFPNSEERVFGETLSETKSILKNKIPKPKPYLLGENMEFGSTEELMTKNIIHDPPTLLPSRVAEINQSLTERGDNNYDTPSFLSRDAAEAVWANRLSPVLSGNLKAKRQFFETAANIGTNKIEIRIPLTLSPGAVRAKTRQLRDSDLTYFGIRNDSDTTKAAFKSEKSQNGLNNSTVDKIFHSVRLVKNMSVSSDAESNDGPDYQNVPLKTNFAPIPTPRPRSKFNNEFPEGLIPFTEREESHRSRKLIKKESDHSSRSISAPPKIKRPDTAKIETQIYDTPRLRRVSPERSRHCPELGYRLSPEPEPDHPRHSKRHPRSPNRVTPIQHSPGQMHRSNVKKTNHSVVHRIDLSPNLNQRSSNYHNYNSPKLTNHSLDHTRRSPEHIRRPNDHTRRSPEHIRRSPDHIRRSPNHTHRLQDQSRRSPDHIGRSPEHTHRPQDHTQSSSDHTQHSTDHSHRPLGHTNRSPDHTNRLSDSIHPSPGHSSPSPEQQQDRTSKQVFSAKVVNENEPCYVNYNRIERRNSSPPNTNEIRSDKKKKTIDKIKQTESQTQRVHDFEYRNKKNIAHVSEKIVNTGPSIDSSLESQRSKRTEKLATPEFTHESEKRVKDKSPVTHVNQVPRKHSGDHSKNNKSEKIKSESRTDTVKKSEGKCSNTKDIANEKNTRNKSPTCILIVENQKAFKDTNKDVKEILVKDVNSRSRSGKKTNDYSPSRRSKYIINYDDQNGTVSSVNKVKTDTTSKKKKHLNEKRTETTKEQKARNKSPTKLPLLQSADTQWNPNGLKYADRKWKTKMHVERTCQVL